MSNKPQEINFFKGMVTNPNSLSAGPGTFREIKNGWCLRDGIIDKRPGFSINPRYSRAPGFSTAYTGLRSLNGNTYYRQDTNFGAFGLDPSDPNVYMQPQQIKNQAFYPYTGACTVDCFQPSAIATDGNKFLAVGKTLFAGIQTQPFILIFSLATGELVASISDAATATNPACKGISWRPDGTAFYFSRFDTNKIYKYVVATKVVTVVAGSGTAGLGFGAGLTGLNIGPIRGIKYRNDGTNDHIYACVSNAIYDANLTTNVGAVVAGSATPGHANGTGAAATFNTPVGIDSFESAPTTFYVLDQGNNAIRKATAAGVVTDLNTSTGTGNLGISCLSPKNGSSVAALLYFTNSTISGSTLNSIDIASPGTINIVCGTGVTDQDGPNNPNIAGSAGFKDAASLCIVQDSIDTNGSYLSPDIKIFVCDYVQSIIKCLDTGPDGSTLSTWAGIVSGAGMFTANNNKGFAGGILPPASNTPAWPLPNAGILSNGQREYGFGFFEYNGTAYLNTNRGVVSFDIPTTYTSSQIIRYAGAPQGLDLVLSLTAGTLLPADYAVAYRIVWGYKTAKGRSIIGAPSSRAMIDNPVGAGAAQNVAITSYIPPGADGTWTYQLYRTNVTFQDTGSGVVADPGDTEFLVFEASPNTADLQAGFVTITDSTPDTLLGADLYTNATQETLSQANAQPPICQDMCLFGDLAIYANTIQKQTMFVNLVGTGGFSGSPTIDFTFSDGAAGFTITGNSTTEIATAGQFKYFTGGTPAANVANTAQSIIRTINQYTANRRINAFYVSTSDGVPGQMAIIAAFFGCPAFSIDSKAVISVDFSPPLPTSDATWTGPSYQSVADVSPNGIFVAKEQDPDAVPLVNNFFAGSSAEPIWRVFPLRTSTIVVKEGSIWRLTGNDPSNVQISILDNTVKLRSPAACSLLNNEVWALTTQGVVAISDNGVRIVSHDIEYQVTQATGTMQAPMDLMNNAWGFGSDDWRTYFCSVMANEDLQKTFVNNPLPGAWSLWDLFIYAITCTNGQIVAAVLDDSARLPAVKGQKPFIITQNDQEMVQSAMSYADFAGSATIATIVGNVVTLTYSSPQGGWYVGSEALPDVGWCLVDVDGTSFYYITGNASGSLTLSSVGTLNVGDTVYVWRPINYHLRFNPMTAGQTFAAKQWGDLLSAFESQNVNQYVMGFLQNSAAEGTAFLEQVKALAQLGPTFSNGVPPPNLASLFLEQVQRLTVPKGAAYGYALEWILDHSEAFSYMVLKAIGAETLGTGSDKVQQ